MKSKIINGYEIIDFVGKGQFATVYKCRKVNDINNLLAIKIFNLEYVYSEFRTNGNDNRIAREIQALRMVNHENVISLVDEGTFADNNQTYVYVVMEYIDGMDLHNYIHSRQLSFLEIEDIFRQILEGLDAVHSLNIVHRDLKPQNIFITNNGKIKLLDFGLSKFIDFTSITSTGAVIGSPLYMSPEQIRDSKNIDYRSDYYAAGIILFELITKKHPYGEIASREHLFYKIINEPLISVIQFVPSTPNCIDNLILNLLNKSNYQRPNNKEEILKYLEIMHTEGTCNTKTEFAPNFYLRVWNEKSVLGDYYNDGNKIENVVFPINHQSKQKNLLKHIKDHNINFFVDPSTMRLAYHTFADVKGLVELSYAPKGFNRLELDDLRGLDQKKNYVSLVVEEQLKHNPNYIVSPFHVSNNSNLVTIKNASAETWFTVDIKLLKETKDYLISNNIAKKLIGGFCIKADVLTAQTEREYFLNVLSGLPCDVYWIYVDCIDNNAGSAQLYHYISTLIELQQSTNKPVIAGRVNSIGLLLSAFGLHGFEAGSARFESFYEDLYKDESDSFNMYVMYYIPELLRNVAVERKNPSKIISMLKNKSGIDLMCGCPYCRDKKPEELLVESNTRKHFLYRRQEEMVILRSLSIPERLNYMEERIKNAINYYKSLSPIFKDSDYSFLKTWQRILPELRNKFEHKG